MLAAPPRMAAVQVAAGVGAKLLNPGDLLAQVLSRRRRASGGKKGGPLADLPEPWLSSRKGRKKKDRCRQRPEFREETPKKGSNPATPIAVLHCTI